MNTTVRLKASEITKDWRVVDAAGRPLGRVASEAAVLLRGKHKPTFEPHLDGGDFVIVVNASQVIVTGRKTEQMKYHRHSGYPGGLKTRSYAEQFARFPERVLEQAIWGMLPDGPLGKAMLRHLKVYRGSTHPHQSPKRGTVHSTRRSPWPCRPSSRCPPISRQQPSQCSKEQARSGKCLAGTSAVWSP